MNYKKIILSFFCPVLLTAQLHGEWNRPKLYPASDYSVRHLVWTDPHLENGFIQYDYQTQLAVLRHVNDASSVITYANDNISLLELFISSNQYCKVRGFFVEEGITKVVVKRITRVSCIVGCSLDFVYLPTTLTDADAFFRTDLNYKIKWVFVTTRGGMTIGGCGNWSRGILFEHFVYNGMIITPSAGYDNSGFLRSVRNLYMTDRSKNLLAFDEAAYSAPDKILNLQDIPYEQLFEDIKYKPVSEYHSHFSVMSGSHQYSPILGITPKNEYNLFVPDSDAGVLEIDPYSKTHYYHPVGLNDGDYNEVRNHRIDYNKLFGLNNVIIGEGTYAIDSRGWFYHEAPESKNRLTYIPKSPVYMKGLNDTEINTLILGAVDPVFVLQGINHANHIVFLGNSYNSDGFNFINDEKIYAKSNLIHPDVQYNLEAFDYLDMIVAFNTVNTAQLNDMYFEKTKANQSAHFKYNVVKRTGLVETMQTVEDIFHVSSYDLSLKYEIESVPAGISAKMEHNKIILTQTGRVTPGIVNVKVYWGEKQSRSYELRVTVEETLVGGSDVSSVVLDESNMDIVMYLNESALLHARVLPADAYDTGLVWESDNPGAVEVNQSGRLTAKARGNATVTVSSKVKPNVKQTVNITAMKQYDTSTRLKHLSVENTTAMSPTFYSNAFNYVIYIPYSTKVPNITAIPESELATVSYSWNLTDTLRVGFNGPKQIRVSVSGQMESVYEIIFRRQSGNPDLEAVSITGNRNREWRIDLNDKSEYILHVSNDCNSIRFGEVSVVYPLTIANIPPDEFPLNVGENVFEWESHAEDRSISRKYKFYVIREEFRLNDFQIREIYDDENGIEHDETVGVNLDNGYITKDVSYLTKKIQIIPRANSEIARFTGDVDLYELKNGNNEFTLHVDNGYGENARDIVINIYKHWKDVYVLQDLSVKNYSITPAFSPDTYEYFLNVSKNTDKINIVASPESPAILSGNTDEQTVLEGNNRYSICVTSRENNTHHINYILNVHRDSFDYRYDLSDLTVIPATPFKFSPEQTFYRLFTGYEEVEINAVPSSPDAYFSPVYDLPGVKRLNPGDNYFIFLVFSAKGIFFEIYTVQITYSVPTRLEKTGNPATVQVYTVNGVLHVNSPAAERINVYSVAGTLLYSFDKPADASTFHAFTPSSFYLSPVLIVRGSSGWVRKTAVI